MVPWTAAANGSVLFAMVLETLIADPLGAKMPDAEDARKKMRKQAGEAKEGRDSDNE